MGNQSSSLGKRETDLGYDPTEFYEVLDSELVRIKNCTFTKDAVLPNEYQLSQALIKSCHRLNSKLINVESGDDIALNSFTIAATNEYERPKLVSDHFRSAFGNEHSSVQTRRSTSSCFSPDNNEENVENMFLKFKFEVHLEIFPEIEVLKVVFTRDNIYNLVHVMEKFPLHRTSDLKTGCMEEIRLNRSENFHCIVSELFIPKNLTQRRVAGFVRSSTHIYCWMLI
jgi:hypothetical protein